MLFRRYKSIDWRHVGLRVLRETWDDDVFGRAAQFSYFLVFSVVPVLLIITVILGYLAQANETRRNLLQYLSQVIPGSSFQLVRNSLDQITKHASGGKLWVGVLTTLWAASSGMSSIIDGLNKAYEVHDTRPWWKSRVLAVVLTLALSALIVVALIILLYGSQFGGLLAGWLGLGSGLRSLWMFLRWPLVISFALLAFWLVYRFAPNLDQQEWWWIAPGSAAVFSYGSSSVLGYGCTSTTSLRTAPYMALWEPLLFCFSGCIFQALVS